ncbi:MAG: 4Fe-4S dicluster domain-containing protein [Candidatus Cloacimonetes bacterium]|nr:4Fe-4S dicluster domain-containing protein [Candidatus Cloacimonadota bacterium]MCF7813443.1 4Fe-4S dicluster domain-containing protein [Candidatus Cloacimonadota bacterium]MCF7867736.1 4Fe-4S dicluster domain-containing protein [Candidatus Cloacimonadota bacterium]MCF7883178.1 4Fe-4S dicluster domain-containing protein [Candidatus Cloacimonadota bacterium]
MGDKREMINVYIGGELFKVPEGSTIISAMEYAGFQLKKGVGCREGYCGACATVYREKGDYKLQGGLACQTVVTEGMAIAMIPFVPAEKPIYDLNELEADVSTFTELFPNVFRCVSCNTCTKACPQEIQVMDYIQAIIRGDIKRAANLSFDCIRCGLCALRCPAEIVQYNNAILARRLYAKYLAPKSPELEARLKELEKGKYDKEIDKMKAMPKDKLSKKYYKREIKIS